MTPAAAATPTPTTKQVLLQRLEGLQKIPTIPAVLAPLLRYLQQPADQIDVQKVTDLLSQDKSLAAQCLQMANSPLFGTSRKVDSLRAAVVSLGFHHVSDIAMSCGVLNILPSHKCSLNPVVFWEHSLGCALSHEVAPTIVAIGVSTGGPKALQDILPHLPEDLTVPVIIVQHMPMGFTAALARRLDGLCSVSVVEACDGETVKPGVIYIAPSGLHLIVQRSSSRTTISLSETPLHQLHTPSIDVMMRSVASAYRSSAMGIIMTGMGADGAQGMNAIHQAGGITVGQDENTCVVYGMPRVCAQMKNLDRVVPLGQIPREIMQATRYCKRVQCRPGE